MGSPSIIPCVQIPKAKPLQVRLPFGGALQSFANFADGPPANCALIHSLILQIMPTLGGMTCFLNVLNVIKVLQDFANNPLDPGNVKELITAIEKVAECFGVFAQIPFMIKDILQLIIAYLRCFIQAAESILNFQAGIDLNSAEGNPVMLASLTCAQDNAQTSLQQLMQALAVIEPLMGMLKPLMKLGGVGATLPSLSQLAGEKDPGKALKELDNVLEQLQAIVDALPG